MIQSVFIGSDSEMIARILTLHNAGSEILDATFGHGGFWRWEVPIASETLNLTAIDRRMGCQDLTRRKASPGILRHFARADWTALPFRDRSFDVVICDPPFMSRAGSKSVMNRRYTSNESYQDLLLSLQRALGEFDRVLKRGGFVVLKMMDLTEGRRRRFAHIDIANLLWAGRAMLGGQQRFGHALAGKRDRVFGPFRITRAGKDSRTPLIFLVLRGL